jgi:tetratricopeptide (TPR) repeat protein
MCGIDAPNKPIQVQIMKFLTAIAAAAIVAVSLPGHVLAAGSDSMQMSRPSADDTYRKAVREVKAENFRRAISLLNDVVKEKPRHPDALNYLGFSHRKLGDYAIAVSYYKRALSLDAEHKGANEYLGQAYVELGNIVAAEERLASLAKICGMDCDEYKSLKKSIDEVKAKMPRPNQS